VVTRALPISETPPAPKVPERGEEAPVNGYGRIRPSATRPPRRAGTREDEHLPRPGQRGPVTNMREEVLSAQDLAKARKLGVEARAVVPTRSALRSYKLLTEADASSVREERSVGCVGVAVPDGAHS